MQQEDTAQTPNMEAQEMPNIPALFAAIKQLDAAIADLQVQRQSAARELAQALQTANQLAAALNIGQEGAAFSEAQPTMRAPIATPSVSKVAPKYRDPVTGQTWTGRGKPPAWIAGKDREQFLIAENAGGEATNVEEGGALSGAEENYAPTSDEHAVEPVSSTSEDSFIPSGQPGLQTPNFDLSPVDDELPI